MWDLIVMDLWWWLVIVCNEINEVIGCDNKGWLWKNVCVVIVDFVICKFWFWVKLYLFWKFIVRFIGLGLGEMFIKIVIFKGGLCLVIIKEVWLCFVYFVSESLVWWNLIWCVWILIWINDSWEFV